MTCDHLSCRLDSLMPHPKALPLSRMRHYQGEIYKGKINVRAITTMQHSDKNFVCASPLFLAVSIFQIIYTLCG